MVSASIARFLPIASLLRINPKTAAARGSMRSKCREVPNGARPQESFVVSQNLSPHPAPLGIAPLEQIIERDHPPALSRGQHFQRRPSGQDVEEVAGGAGEAVGPV